MCIAVFIWRSDPLYPFLLLLNRDENHNRPTTPLGWWEDDDGAQIVGGRDGKAGGTWLGCTTHGRLAFLTNVRENSCSNSQQVVVVVKSRGELPIRFLKSRKSPKEFAEELEEEAEQFNGFNLIVADLQSLSMLYITNRPPEYGLSVTQVSPGIHVLSNAKLDTPWPKAQRLRRSFEEVVEKGLDADISLEKMSEILMKDRSKTCESEQLPGIYPPEFEYELSSIFVEANTPSGRYGTRSTSAVVLRRSGGIVSFYERNLESDVWKEQTISFDIQTHKVAS